MAMLGGSFGSRGEGGQWIILAWANHFSFLRGGHVCFGPVALKLSVIMCQSAKLTLLAIQFGPNMLVPLVQTAGASRQCPSCNLKQAGPSDGALGDTHTHTRVKRHRDTYTCKYTHAHTDQCQTYQSAQVFPN